MIDIKIEEAPKEHIDVLGDSIIENEIIDVLAGTVAIYTAEEDDNDYVLQISSL